MKLLCTLLVPSLALALGWLSPAPSPAPQNRATQGEDEEGGPAVRQKWPWGTEEDVARKQIEVQGLWRLIEAEVDGVYLDPGGAVGYALFTEREFAMEVHLKDPLGMRASDGLMFQTGIHRYTWEASGRMSSSALIGTNNVNSAGVFDFERPGTSRQYEVEIDVGGLVLHAGVNRFRFLREGPSPFDDEEDTSPFGYRRYLDDEEPDPAEREDGAERRR